MGEMVIIMTESEIQKEVVKYLKDRNCLVFRMNSGYIRKNVKLSPPGTPDLLVITRSGKVIWLEIKTETGKLNPKQKSMIYELATRKQHVYIIRDKDELKYILTE